VRLKTAQDTLRRCIYRIAYIQKMQFVPSVHILVLSLAFASLFVMLFVEASMLIFVFVGYMFIYSLYLIGLLDQPFREGEGTVVDVVSLYQLREFVLKMEEEAGGSWEG
jgi:hypothetical protein